MNVRAQDDHLSRLWFTIAVGSLVFAGLFAIAIVVARMPGFDRMVGDPMFFKRCLVVHVTLSLCLWFYAYLAALYHQVPGPSGPRLPHRGAVALGGAGFLGIMAGAGIRGAEPLLVNYIPVIDTPLFVMGLLLFGIAVAIPMLDGRAIREGARDESSPPRSATLGFRMASIAFLIAIATFVVSVFSTPDHLSSTARYEAITWGGGHVLQFASVMAMVGVWHWLLESALGRDEITERAARVLFPLLALPLLAAPLIATENTAGAAYRVFFTDLMRWGIFPAVTLFMGLGARRVFLATRTSGWREVLGDLRVTVFLVSCGLTSVGFVLGALIRGQNTMIPAHYHASIGGVTVTFMGGCYLLLERYGRAVSGRRALRVARAQPIVYGGGQLLFALGFALAGAHGMERKVYGADQHIRSFAETIGMGAMGIGGLVAVAGGLMLLSVVLPALIRNSRSADEAPWRQSCPMAPIARIRSNA